jgi:hypothetical protein
LWMRQCLVERRALPSCFPERMSEIENLINHENTQPGQQQQIRNTHTFTCSEMDGSRSKYLKRLRDARIMWDVTWQLLTLRVRGALWAAKKRSNKEAFISASNFTLGGKRETGPNV